jgi:hypothetical protein
VLFDDAFDVADCFGAEQEIVIEAAEVGIGFEWLGCAKGGAVEKFQGGRRSDVIDETEAGIGGAAKLGVVIEANAGAEDELWHDGEFVLGIEGPDDGALRIGDERMIEIESIGLVLFEIVDDFGAEGDFVFLEESAVELEFAIPPFAEERVGVESRGGIGQSGGEGERSAQSGVIVGCAELYVPIVAEGMAIAEVEILVAVEIARTRIVEQRTKVAGGNAFVACAKESLQGEAFETDSADEVLEVFVIGIASDAVVCGRTVEFGEEERGAWLL